MSAPFVVAIDGTAGSGKSTVARMVARRLGLVHVDTGATYRLVAQRALDGGVPLDDAPALAALARRVAASCRLDGGALVCDGVPVGEEIRTAEVGRASSVVAAHPAVREVLVTMQRGLVPPAGAVVEGRDIGTVVWPDATVKVFLDAREDVRTARRARDLGVEASPVIAAQVRDRDERDANRPVGAMRPAPAARRIDTSQMEPQEVADIIVSGIPAPARPHPKPNRLYRIVRGAWAGILRGPLRMQVEGAHNIPATGPAILAPNHRSLLDIPALAALTKRKVWFMGKEELFRSKAGNRIFTALGGFPVRRGKPDRRALNAALSFLAAGELVGVYPEGTRRPDARFEHLEDGVAYLALKTGAPIVPIALSGTEAVMPKGSKLPRPVKLRVLVGEPFTLGGPVTGIVSRRSVTEATDVARVKMRAVIDRLEPRT